jgi:hypothetical protein
MSEAQPPVEELVVFNADNFRDAQPVSTSFSDPSKLDFPIAQGIETFPNGIIFGDGTTMNSAAWTNKTTPKYQYGGYPAQSLSIGSAIPYGDSANFVVNAPPSDGAATFEPGKYVVITELIVNGANTGGTAANFAAGETITLTERIAITDSTLTKPGFDIPGMPTMTVNRGCFYQASPLISGVNFPAVVMEGIVTIPVGYDQLTISIIGASSNQTGGVVGNLNVATQLYLLK